MAKAKFKLYIQWWKEEKKLKAWADLKWLPNKVLLNTDAGWREMSGGANGNN